MQNNDSGNEPRVPVDGWAAGFGERLRREMERAGVTQVRLVEITGLSAMHLSHFMCGRREPSMGSLRKLLSAMWWVDARELICGGGGAGGTGEQSGAPEQEPRQVVRSSDGLGGTELEPRVGRRWVVVCLEAENAQELGQLMANCADHLIECGFEPSPAEKEEND